MSQIGIIINIKDGTPQSEIKTRRCTLADLTIARTQLDLISEILLNKIK